MRPFFKTWKPLERSNTADVKLFYFIHYLLCRETCRTILNAPSENMWPEVAGYSRNLCSITKNRNYFGGRAIRLFLFSWQSHNSKQLLLCSEKRQYKAHYQVQESKGTLRYLKQDFKRKFRTSFSYRSKRRK